MTNLDKVDHATIDEEETVAEEEFEVVDIPTPDYKEAGKLGIWMSNQ